MSLPHRRLGREGPAVSAIGLGCFAMTDSYGAADEEESIATLDLALDLGVTFFDTAELYGPYTNKLLLGRVLKGRRDGVVVATKFGWRIENGRAAGLDSRPERIRQVAEASLLRLGTDHIDLLYQHRVDPDVPIEEVAGAVADLVREGKVRWFGLSEAGPATIRAAHAVHPVAALQSEYSLWERGLEAAVIPTLQELGIGLVPFAPLGRGFLAGGAPRAEQTSPTDFRHEDPRFQGDNYDRNLRAAEALHALARRKGATAAQVALAWLLHKGPDIVPIPGTRRRTHLRDNADAASIVLTDAELAALDSAFPPGAAAGPRYSPQRMAYTEPRD